MSCQNVTSLASGQEPQATFWTGPDCGGTGMTLPVGVYTTLNGRRLTGPQINGVWCPPHLQIQLWLSEGCIGDPDMTIGGNVTRVYLSSPDLGVGAGKIRSIKITQLASWSDFKLLCCRGDSSVSSAECQRYWGPTSGTGDCDQLMSNWCSQNPWEPSCACLLSKTKDAAPCVDPACINSAAYQNSNQKRILSQRCPDKIVCQQQIVLGNGAVDNVIKANMYQICGNVDPASANGTNQTATTNTTVDRTQSTATQNTGDQNLIILVLILIVAILLFGDDSEKASGSADLAQKLNYSTLLARN